MSGISVTWENRDKRRTFLYLLNIDYVPGNILNISHTFSHLLLEMTYEVGLMLLNQPPPPLPPAPNIAA